MSYSFNIKELDKGRVQYNVYLGSTLIKSGNARNKFVAELTAKKIIKKEQNG